MDVEEAYQNTLEYLYSFVDFSLVKSARLAEAKFELGRMVHLMDLLGNPQQKFPIIHVAGTKGKGSVSSACASVLQEAGYQVGLYTSPHLDDYAERIQIDQTKINHQAVTELVEELKPFIKSVPELTTFEITTALAYLYFARNNVDAAVIEVGLGGRLDATNIVLPVVSVITSLSYDHMFVLGNTLAEIAAEKGGIIKPGIPVVLAPQVEEARSAIRQIATQKAAPLIEVGKDYHYQPEQHSLTQQSFWIWSHSQDDEVNKYFASRGKTGIKPVLITTPLLGDHQIENAAVAYAALSIFRQKQLPFSEADIENGFKKIQWPGRFEIIQQNPPVVLDCAHNRYSAQKLKETLQTYFPDKKALLVFGASEDKDIAGMLAELQPVIDRVIATRSYHPRAIQPENLIPLVEPLGKPIEVCEDVPAALHLALGEVTDGRMILITGSIFVVSDARNTWINDHPC